MKVIELLLTENVDNLGIVGDVVKVRSGYARNFLLPRALATKPTAGAIKRLAKRRAEVEKELKVIRGQREAVFAKLEKFELTMQRSANESGILYGGVSQHDIAQALRNEGLTIEDRMVRIGEQIKRLDTYQIPIVLDSDLKTEIKLWIVSDKPREELEAGAEAAAEPAAEAPAEGKGKKKKDKAAQAEGEAAEAEAKPKGKKDKGEAKAEGDAKSDKPAKEKKAKSKGE